MRTLRIHYLQHVPYEGIGFIETWANKNLHTLTATKLYVQPTLPEINDFDWLIIMGGPMSVNDEAIHPWLKEEMRLIKLAIESNKTVIGICLGAQLVAKALGARVYPNLLKEIGWFPILLNENAKQETLLNGFIDSMKVFHWHSDTFDLPKNAKHLIKSDACNNQAFLYNERVLGLQFHLEVTPETLKCMIENCRYELVPEEYIQTEEKIISEDILCIQANAVLTRLLNKLEER
ncbi:MAG: type 1 glutamine amidotransferase [Ginsengibacter sp.]|jgi:GMP synthase-like glutamine amidotransferase